MSSYAIIGHGASPVGKRWGLKIDQCGTVVRMWDCQWQDVVDYGARYDYGFFEIHQGLMQSFDRNRCRVPAKGWVGSVLGAVADERLPPKVERVHQEKWNAIGLRMGGLGLTGRLQFTRGTIAACWAIERARRKDEVILVGFDNIVWGRTLSIEKGYPTRYLKSPGSLSFEGYTEGQTKFGNHDYAIELPVMLELARKRKVLVTSATDIWS